MEDNPAVTIFLEDRKDGGLGDAIVGPVPMGLLTVENSVRRVQLKLRSVQPILLVRVAHSRELTASFLVDGRSWPSRAEGSAVTSMRLPIQDDLEAHTILCAHRGMHLLCIDIEVCVYRSYTCKDGRTFQAPKWNAEQARAAAVLAREILPRTTLTRSEDDPFERNLSHGIARGPDILQAIHLTAWSLAALVVSLGHADLSSDYAVREPGDIDVSETLEALRRDIRSLKPREAGPIHVGARRFSTTQIVRADSRTPRLDLAVPLLACDATLEYLDNTVGAEGAHQILTTIRRRLATLSDPRARPPAMASVRAWQEGTPFGSAALHLRNGLLQLLALSRDAARAATLGRGAKGLIAGFLDHRLFETWCWASLYEAIGGDLATLRDNCADPQSSLYVNSCELIAAGLPGGKNRCRELLHGWRDGTAMPSSYAPDFLVRFANRPAIIVDAKFRMGNSPEEPCEPDAFKEVQAYMEEFSAPAALILVPAMPSAISIGSRVSNWTLIEGGPADKRRRVGIVEVAPGLEGQRDTIRQMLDDLNALVS